MNKPAIIGFDRRLGVGDIIAALPALFVLKQLYPEARLVFITNKFGYYLCKNFDFIDRLLVQGEHFADGGGALSKIIDEQGIDTLILAHRTSENIRLAKKSKARLIITWRHLHSLFSPRFKHPRHIKRQQRLEITRCLDLVRMINPKLYDERYANLELKSLPVRIKTQPQNKAFVDEFIQKEGLKGKRLVGVSIFGLSSAAYNLAPKDWIELIRALASEFKELHFVFMNFKGSGYEFENFKEGNIKVFMNDENLLNLCELSSRLSLCISLSTGNIHIADNLGVPSIGFYPQSDKVLFACGQYGARFSPFYLPKHWAQEYEGYKRGFYEFCKLELESLEAKWKLYT